MLDTERAFSWPIALTIVTLITALLIGFIFYRTETWPLRAAHAGVGETERVARELRDAFKDVAHLQPRITINNRVYLEETTQTSELSLVSRRVEVEHEFENTWAGSSKRVKLHGTYAVRAGFDLRQNVEVDLRPDEIFIRLPHAQILGIEEEAIQVLEFDNGYWNRISSADVQGELATLPRLARERAEAASLPAQAEQTLQQQIQARVHTSEPVRLHFGTDAPPQ